MGRIDTEEPSHAGVELQQTTPHETIDNLPPLLEEDLYEPPHHYQPPPPSPPPKTTPTPAAEVHSFPPPQDHHFSAAADHVHSFPPPQDVHSFPPPQDQDYVMPPPEKPVVGQPFPQRPAFHMNLQPTSQPQFVAHNVNHVPSPLLTQQNLLPTQPWKTSLFDCMSNPKNAIITLFFPCVTFGQIAEILDSGNTTCATSGMLYSLIACCIAMPCLMSCGYRSKLRSKYGLVEAPAPDWAIHCCCECCALCQEYRELEQRGIDPSIGWVGNVAQQHKQQQFGMTPPMQQRMF